MPVDVEVTTSAGAKTYRVTVQRAEQDFYFKTDARPLMVRFDKGSWILKDLEFARGTGELAYQLAHDDDVMGRVQAARDLAGRPDEEEAVRALALALREDRFWGVRLEAAQALAKSKGDVARASLLAGCADEKASVRRECLAGLGKSGEGLEKEARGLFAADPSYQVQTQALRTLARLEVGDRYELAASAVAQASEDDVVAEAGLEVLGGLDDDRALALLRAQLAPDQRPSRRRAAIGALARATERLQRDARGDLVAVLLAAADTLPAPARVTALGTLATLDPTGVRTRLQQIADPDSNSVSSERVRRSASRALQLLVSDAPKTTTDAASEMAELKRQIESLTTRLKDLERRLPER
jgi:aminopeptidase N